MAMRPGYVVFSQTRPQPVYPGLMRTGGFNLASSAAVSLAAAAPAAHFRRAAFEALGHGFDPTA